MLHQIFNLIEVSKRSNILTALLFISLADSAIAQDHVSDSVYNLKTITVKAYLQEQSLFRLTTSVGAISRTQLENQTQISLLPHFNTIVVERIVKRQPGS